MSRSPMPLSLEKHNIVAGIGLINTVVSSTVFKEKQFNL